MEQNLTPGSQNCKIGSLGQATVSKNSKNNKINFFSLDILAEFWHGISVDHRYSELYSEMKKKSVAKFCHGNLLSVYHCYFAPIPMSNNNIFN